MNHHHRPTFCLIVSTIFFLTRDQPFLTHHQPFLSVSSTRYCIIPYTWHFSKWRTTFVQHRKFANLSTVQQLCSAQERNTQRVLSTGDALLSLGLCHAGSSASSACSAPDGQASWHRCCAQKGWVWPSGLFQWLVVICWGFMFAEAFRLLLSLGNLIFGPYPFNHKTYLQRSIEKYKTNCYASPMQPLISHVPSQKSPNSHPSAGEPPKYPGI